MADKTEIKVACVWSDTGWCWLDCRPMSMGVKFWIADVNARGGLHVPALGRRLPVRLVGADDRSHPPTAIAHYERILAEGVDVVVSGGSSEIQELLVPLTEKAGIVNINAGAPSDDLFNGTRYHLLATGTALRGLASNPLRPKFWKQHGLTRIAQIYPETGGWIPYSEGLKAAAEAEGLTMVLRWTAPALGRWSTQYGTLPEDFTDWSGIIDRVEAARPDALVIAFPAPAQYHLLREMRRRDLWYPYVEITYGQAMTKTGLGADDLLYVFNTGAFVPVVEKSATGGALPVTVGYTRSQFAQRTAELMPRAGAGAVGLSHYLALAMWEYLVQAGGSIDADTVMKTALSNPPGMANMLGPIEFLPNGMRRLTDASDLTIGQIQRDPDSGDLCTVTVAPDERAAGAVVLPSPTWGRRVAPWYANGGPVPQEA